MQDGERSDEDSRSYHLAMLYSSDGVADCVSTIMVRMTVRMGHCYNSPCLSTVSGSDMCASLRSIGTSLGAA